MSGGGALDAKAVMQGVARSFLEEGKVKQRGRRYVVPYCLKTEAMATSYMALEALDGTVDFVSSALGGHSSVLKQESGCC